VILASIASAAAARERTAARRGLFTEVQVIIDGGIEGIRVELHFLARKHIALPRLDTQGATATDAQRSYDCYRKTQATDHGFALL
jgi:hypothetical protein